MPFTCPECSVPQSLKIALKIELPPDGRSDEITLQIVKCSECKFSGIAVYEESRRGDLASESVHHLGYRVGKDELDNLGSMIKRCPNPKNPRCDCSAHRRLGRKDASGRWNALEDITLGEAFALAI
jgi:hypothetical protein